MELVLIGLGFCGGVILTGLCWVMFEITRVD